MVDPLLRIGQFAADVGGATRAVDHGTRVGPRSSAARSERGCRLSTPHDVDRIDLIRRLETHGVALEDTLRSSGTELPKCETGPFASLSCHRSDRSHHEWRSP